MEQELLDGIVSKAKEQINAEMQKVKESIKTTVEEVEKQKGYATEEQFNTIKKAQEDAAEKVEGILKKQGLTLADLQEKMYSNAGAIKTIPQVLKEHEEELRKIYRNGMGTKEFMLSKDINGNIHFRPFDRTAKAAGSEATIDGVPAGATAAVVSAMTTAGILRQGANADIVDNFSNTAWIFDLVNTTTASFDKSFATYWEELPKEGAPAIVAEGAPKPLVQYKYRLRNEEYKKIAQLINFTEEFYLDFNQLYQDILGKGRRDVANAVNGVVLADIITQATAYNTAANFGTVPNANGFDAIAAMAAQVDDATFGNMANAALMSTFKKYRLGVEKDTTGGYLNPPSVISNIRFVGNPDMADDAVVVGDLKQYNLIMRGGVIIRVGYNGTDFAENKFSVVMEQFFYNYISPARKTAIVKGPNFDDVIEVITPVTP